MAFWVAACTPLLSKEATFLFIESTTASATRWSRADSLRPDCDHSTKFVLVLLASRDSAWKVKLYKYDRKINYYMNKTKRNRQRKLKNILVNMKCSQSDIVHLHTVQRSAYRGIFPVCGPPESCQHNLRRTAVHTLLRP